jgi:cobalt-zinc-cadmium efflux system outer membrane protein
VAPAANVAGHALPGRELGLEQALRAARDNLDVSFSRRVLNAAQADIVAADRAPLPVLSAKAGQIDLQHGLGSGNPLTQKRIDKAIGIDWTWERGNKRELRTRAAQRNAAAAQADVEDVRLQQVSAAWGAYFDLLAAQDRLVQVQAIQASASQLAATAARRVTAGDLSAQEGARTEIEAQRAQADVLSLQLEVQRASVALSQLIHQPTQLAERTLLRAQASWPALAASEALTDNAVSTLVDQRAEVRASQERVQAAQALVDNARALKRSDITLGSSIDHFPGTSTRLLEVRMQVPLQWGYSYDGEVGRALAELNQAQDALERTRLNASNDMLRLWQDLASATQRAQAYEDNILPRAKRVAEGAELAYNKGAIPLTDLLDARRTLRATLLDALGARADHAKALGAWQLRTDPQSLPGRLASNAL